MITKLLLERGYKSEASVQNFLNPQIDNLLDPYLLLDMDKAINRIRKAIENNEEIWLYGDYDVDGITSITILYKYFEYIGKKVRYYIPSRQEEGYGLNKESLLEIKASGARLVITVDCGITAIEEADYATEIGLDLIITDHHECQEVIPKAIAIVNPKRGDYPFKMLAGCGVAFKLVQALLKEQFSEFYPTVIDILALGTIADIVPLVEENRIFTKLGLDQMQTSSNYGIKALIREANLENKEINAGHIGFVIAPRINASGRIGNPKIAVEMFITNDKKQADAIAKSLSELNQQRQEQEKQIFIEAEAYIEKEIDLGKERILLVVGSGWHTGIIGIVASKLSEKYSRPSIILNVEGDYAKGSARSIEGISIFEVLSNFKNLFEKFGGHDQAAGLSLKSENLKKLKRALIAYGQEKIPNYQLILSKKVSGVLEPKMITHKLIEEIEQLKPFGLANPKPQFEFKNLTIEDYKRIGKKQNHLKMYVNDGNRIYEALAFNRGDMVSFLRKNDKINLLLTIEKNNFQNIETIQFLVQDMVKDRMPLSTTIDYRAQMAIYNFLKTETHLFYESKFTELQGFDIIFSRANANVLILYSYKDLITFKDYVLKNNVYKYTIHFNTFDRNEHRDEYLDVVFMPFSDTLQDIDKEIYGVHIPSKKLTFSEFVPDRNDLMNFYKKLSDNTGLSLVKLTKQMGYSFPKCLFCLDLLKEMDLYDSNVYGGLLDTKALTKPNRKIDLETIPLFVKLNTNWRK